jgi:hypothetical protein
MNLLGTSTTLTGTVSFLIRKLTLNHGTEDHTSRFADRDMFMRFHWKLAIGHRAVQQRYNSIIKISDIDIPELTAVPEFGPLSCEGAGDDESDNSESDEESSGTSDTDSWLGGDSD